MARSNTILHPLAQSSNALYSSVHHLTSLKKKKRKMERKIVGATPLKLVNDKSALTMYLILDLSATPIRPN